MLDTAKRPPPNGCQPWGTPPDYQGGNPPSIPVAVPLDGRSREADDGKRRGDAFRRSSGGEECVLSSGLAAKRVAVALWLVTTALAVTGVGLAIVAGQSWTDFARSFSLGQLTAAPAFTTVGLVLATRRPQHPVGRLFLALGALFGLGLVCATYALESHAGGPLPAAGIAGWLQNWVWVPAYALLPLALLLLPDGTLPSRRWWPLVWLILAATAVATVTHLLLPAPFATGTHFTNPLGWESAGPRLAEFDELVLSVAILAMLPAAASLLVRLRRARGEQRAQLRFFCQISAIAIVAYVALGTAGLPWLAFALSWPTVAVAAGVAILRHGLFDIDVVVSRAVVVTVLAAFLAFVYLAVVVGIGTLVRARRDDPLLAIAATAVAALAFQPVHARVRAAADRLVYGRRASAYQVLTRLSRRLHDPVPATELLAELVRLLAEATGAERAEAWLRVGDRLRATAVWPAGTSTAPVEIGLDQADRLPGADHLQPVSDRDELLGVLALTKRRGDTVTAADAELASGLAAQAGLVLRNARLATELQDSMAALRTSRQRLVTAHDAERRRLERDLHDGVQQHLLALKAKLGAVQALVDQGRTDRASAVLLGLAGDADGAIAELRDVARGIYPPLLAEQGLAVALRARVRSVPVAVELQVHDVDRLPGEVEAALYFCCLEALANVTKHAAARLVMLRLARADGQMTLQVRDDGAGFDAAAVPMGTGLASLRDRVEALGGTLVIRSVPLEGTSVEARVPLSATVSPAASPQGTATPHAPDGEPSTPR